MRDNSRLVYSTETGRIKSPSRNTTPSEPQDPGDGTVRLHRETKGRKGKGVVLIKGLTLPEAELKALAKRLKQLCGTGGAVKDGVIEIQGDQRDKLKSELERLGHRVKLAGS